MSPTFNCSRAVTRRRALPWTLLRSPTCGVAVAGTLWSGIGESKRSPRAMTTCPIIGQAVGGAVADEQRRQSPRLQTCQAGPGFGAEYAPEPLGHPNLGSDPHREGSKSQNILLKRFLTILLENCFFSRQTSALVPYSALQTICYSMSFINKCSKSQILKYITKNFL